MLLRTLTNEAGRGSKYWERKSERTRIYSERLRQRIIEEGWSSLRALGAATSISVLTRKHLDSCFLSPYLLIDDGHERHHGREEGHWNIHGAHAHSERLTLGIQSEGEVHGTEHRDGKPTQKQ